MLSNLYLKIFLSIVLLTGIEFLIRNLIPPPCLDCCFGLDRGYLATEFYCSSWPGFIAGFVSVFVATIYLDCRFLIRAGMFLVYLLFPAFELLRQIGFYIGYFSHLPGYWLYDSSVHGAIIGLGLSVVVTKLYMRRIGA